MGNKYFKKLNYTLGDEDTSVELDILSENAKNVYAIAGSGGRVLPLLAKTPIQLTCVDILSEQLFITELRIESVKVFSHEQYCGFWGYPPFKMTPKERKELFEEIQISDQARIFLNEYFGARAWSKIIYMGKFEKMLISLSKVNRFFTGRAGSRIFDTTSLEDQNAYFEKHFPHLQWSIVLFLLGNSTVLNSILYNGDFPKKNIAGSTYSNFKRIFNSIFNTIPIRKSFFAQMTFWGEIKYPEGNLIEVNSELFYKTQVGARRTKISYLQGDIVELIKNNDEEVNFVSLSDVPSFMNGDMEEMYLQEIRRNISKDGVVIVRGNLRITNPNSAGFELLNEKYKYIISRETTQLWEIDIYQKT